jgi:prevent-host-death family protein
MATVKYVTATEAKSNLAAHLKAVQTRGARIVITKRGKAIARLEPMGRDDSASYYGFMKGTVRVIGDIIAPIDVEWNAVKGRM